MFPSHSEGNPETIAHPSPPQCHWQWNLFGAGMENLGRNDLPERISLPIPDADSILVRHDACGICFSDVKIMRQGNAHSRLTGRNLRENPVILGHELCVTVMAVGANRQSEFSAGTRYVLQPDIFYQGRQETYGYLSGGGMAQYGIMDKRILNGDEGCYLLPLDTQSGFAEAALLEPWACVSAAYHWARNPNTKQSPAVTLAHPPTVDLFIAHTEKLNSGDSILFNFDADTPMLGLYPLDIGRIHYDALHLVGRTQNWRDDLKPQGTVWFLGAAGPMGQMHVERAVRLPNPPARIVCTDINALRLAALEKRVGEIASQRGITMDFVHGVGEQAENQMSALVPHGFDDIIVLVPSAALVESAFPQLASGGVLNLFAGIPRGTIVPLPLGDIVRKNVRIVGTTGSGIADMAAVMDGWQRGEIITNRDVAAIGGLTAFKTGLVAVQDGLFSAKTVIYPQLDFPLTPLAELYRCFPTVAAGLDILGHWTNGAERELLEIAPKLEN